METKNFVPWSFALVFAVLATSQVLHAAGGSAEHVRLAPPIGPHWLYKLVPVNNTFANAPGSQYLGNVGLWNTLGQDGWEYVGVLPDRELLTGPIVNNPSYTNGQAVLHSHMLVFKKPS